MSRVLIVIDMQNDFVTGSLGSKEARAIVPNVQSKNMRIAEIGYFLPGTRIRKTIWILRKEKNFR